MYLEYVYDAEYHRGGDLTEERGKRRPSPCKCSCCWLVAHAHAHVHEHIHEQVHVLGELYLIAGLNIVFE